MGLWWQRRCSRSQRCKAAAAAAAGATRPVGLGRAVSWDEQGVDAGRVVWNKQGRDTAGDAQATREGQDCGMNSGNSEILAVIPKLKPSRWRPSTVTLEPIMRSLAVSLWRRKYLPDTPEPPMASDASSVAWRNGSSRWDRQRQIGLTAPDRIGATLKLATSLPSPACTRASDHIVTLEVAAAGIVGGAEGRAALVANFNFLGCNGRPPSPARPAAFGGLLPPARHLRLPGGHRGLPSPLQA